ncbi:uncharacterized protein KY384_004969 [Bacidia gigantensis]|uniref:uncharacterized protein n=1 Tax=Bacidia gigantensis TaxID=2732470 RepID=UPI001D03DE8C|nr:uncharacterized protein KY384_004969 [Bacidia gigantensis]KAG8530466.1 hypothetical protein KY384_004969 [Bacidia gigantensis]
MAGGQHAKATAGRDGQGQIRERSSLLPSNRKLRHLQGLSLRNLELRKTASHPRGRTIDDESLPSTLKTPEKALAQKEKAKLEHSHSSVDLKQKAKDVPERTVADKRGAAEERLSVSRLKRADTLNWTNASSRLRQEKLEQATRGKMADVWYSLHLGTTVDPIYISEVIRETLNPSFRFFDMNTYGAFVTRREEITIRFWAKTNATDSDVLLIDLNVNLRSLYFIGKTVPENLALESFSLPLPRNAVLFHLSDGIYTSFTDLPNDEQGGSPKASRKASQQVQSTSSFDALMRLSNIDNCIQDAISTRDRLMTQIDNILHQQEEKRDAVNAASQAQESLASTTRSLGACRKQVQSVENHRSKLQASLSSRRAAILSGQDTQQKSQGNLAKGRVELSSREKARQGIKSDLSGQIRRIGEDLSSIYPIAPVSDGSLSFSIRNSVLPVAGSQPHQDPIESATALGHAAHTTHLLSHYLSTPVPYPISPNGSTSTIYDPISTSLPSEAARTFPLYQKGAVAYRFDYGVFLLNSNIELIMSRQGARLIDLRYTLGNLKYILTVITEGKGEIPGRKRGQIKGLNGSLKGSSRDSSIGSRHLEKKAVEGENSDAKELRRALEDSRIH